MKAAEEEKGDGQGEEEKEDDTVLGTAARKENHPGRAGWISG